MKSCSGSKRPPLLAISEGDQGDPVLPGDEVANLADNRGLALGGDHGPALEIALGFPMCSKIREWEARSTSLRNSHATPPSLQA